MGSETLESIASKCLQSKLLNNDFKILWHAGEPLTAGIDFYKNALKLINKYNPPEKKFKMAIQTNGILLNDEWCKFFIDNDIEIGVSIDGPEHIHNYNRKNWSGKGSFREVMRGVKLLKDYKIPLLVLSVVTKYSLDYPKEIFNFFLENEAEWVGFNVDEIGNSNLFSSLKDGNHISPEIMRKYSSFISTFYDYWRKNNKKITVREFDELVGIIHAKLRDPHHRRVPNETQELKIITIQKNGDITTFSPEFAGGTSIEYNNFIVGNINTINTLDEIKNHPVLLKMKEDIEVGIANCAKTCKYFDLCGGGFTSNKFFENRSLRSTETTGCILQRQKISSIVMEKLIDESNIRRTQ